MVVLPRKPCAEKLGDGHYTKFQSLFSWACSSLCEWTKQGARLLEQLVSCVWSAPCQRCDRADSSSPAAASWLWSQLQPAQLHCATRLAPAAQPQPLPGQGRANLTSSRVWSRMNTFMYQALMNIHSSERSRCPKQLFQVSNNIWH